MKVTTVLNLHVLFLLSIIFLLSTAMLTAQVTIKEKVEIKPKGRQFNDKIKGISSLPSSWYIAPYSGTYAGVINLEARGAAPQEGSLTVMYQDRLRDTTLIFDVSDYIYRRDSYITYYLFMPIGEFQYTIIPTTFFRSFSYEGTTYKYFQIPYVLKGDTIKFSYYDWTEASEYSRGRDVEMAVNSPSHSREMFNEGDLQDLKLCGIDLLPLSFSVMQSDSILTIGSSTVLNIWPNGNIIFDSLMTFEVDSAQYVKFIYDSGTSIDTLDSPLDSVYSHDAFSGKIKFLVAGEKPDKPVPVAICARYMFDSTRVFEDTIVVKGSEIMLGETKYYYATKDNTTGVATIHETYTPSLPSGSDVLTTDIWGDNPVSVVVTDPAKSGTKMGVYWEKEKRIPTDTAHNLPTGMIRLIGRYWHKDSVYTVELKTVNYSNPTSLGIEVKPPAKLLTPGQSPTYRLSRDVFDHEIDIDSICIYYGGIFGVPPHFLKGQMLKEAGKKVFGSDTCFAPSYRYEPFTNGRVAQLSSFWTKFPDKYDDLWLVDSTRTGKEMGTGKDVPVHNYVCYMPYPRTHKTVWNIIVENSELVETGSEAAHKVYGSRNSDGTMKFSDKYKKIYKKYQDFLKKAEDTDELDLNGKTVADYSRELMIEWLRDSWHGDGAINMAAQTRLASSYGLLQMMYATAVDRGYPSKNSNISPEDFNITDTNMTYSMRHMKKLLKDKLTSVVEQNGNWPNGFEYLYRKYLWPVWNTGDESKGALYSKLVYLYSNIFMPQNK